MSYDLHLFLPVDGEDPLVTARADFEESTPLNAAARERIARTVAALKAFEPSLEVFELEDGVQVAEPEGASGISIELSAGTGAISVPYWHEGGAKEILGRMSAYARIVHEATGFLVFDPQRDALLTPASGFVIAEDVYAVGVRALQPDRSKPWWKLW